MLPCNIGITPRKVSQLAVLKVLISAGEASGDTYGALLVNKLREQNSQLDLFGCAGPHLRHAGVRAVVRSESLSVVGIFEVIGHLPRIWREYRKLLAAIDRERPSLAVLTDSPDFNLRVARRLHRRGIPVVYLVAPQVWAWRKDRLPLMRRVLTRLLCIFPFEEKFFNDNGVPAVYIGHPLARRIAASTTRAEFLEANRVPPNAPVIALLPGSRRGEAKRHLPALLDAAERLARDYGAVFVLPASATTGAEFFRGLIFGERKPAASIQVLEGQAWDALAHSDLALAASGTVTVEAALLGTPMVTFYRVTWGSWLIGKLLVRVPFYCMVNLIAGRKIVPELMQGEMTGERIAAEAGRLLSDPKLREDMRRDLVEVRTALSGSADPMTRAAEEIWKLQGERAGAVA